MNAYKLLKLMYLCERDYYLLSEKFITNDDLYSMQYGGVLSNVYNLMKNRYNNNDSHIWNDVLKSQDHGKQKTVSIINKEFKISTLEENEKIYYRSKL